MAKKLVVLAVALAALISFYSRVRPEQREPVIPPVGISTRVSTTIPEPEAHREPHTSEKFGSHPAPLAGQQELTEILAGVRRLSRDDHEGLRRLYDQAKKWMTNDPSALSEIQAAWSTLTSATLEESFFALSASIRHGRAPGAVVSSLMAFQPPPRTFALDPHDDGNDALANYERMQSYALREIRKQEEAGNIRLSHDERKLLLNEIQRKIAGENSLDILLEMVALLERWDEIKIIDEGLNAKNPRDRELIRTVVGLK